MKRSIPLVALTVLAASQATNAQTQTPGSGQLLQQLTLPPAPPPKDKPALSIEEPGNAVAASSETPIPVKHIAITGNTLLSTEHLHRLVASAEGQTVNLRILQSLAARITDAYHRQGYPLTRAYVPAQTIKDGEITLAVIEARYGKVTLNNQSTTSNRPLENTLAPLTSGSTVSEWTLDRSLLLLSDIPGVIVNSTVRPGAAAGTSDLEIDTTSAPRYSALLALDDFGNRYTGRVRGTVSFDINSPLHQGDRLDFNALTSGSGMTYGLIGYRYLLNGQGTTLGASASGLHYHLIGDLSDLNAHGTAQVESINLTHPFVRNTGWNLYGQLQFDHKTLKDDIDLVSIRTDRHTNGFTAILAGDVRDNYGITNFNVSATWARVTFDDDLARFIDSISAETQGHDAHYNLTLSRLFQLNEVNGLYVAFTGQLASRNLDPSDQFYLGGPSNARGYDVGALTGAQGGLLTLEWRRIVPIPTRGVWQASLFGDHGRIQVYKDPFVPGTNSSTLSDVGASLHWDGPRQWVVSMQVAAPVGAASPLLHDSPGTRFWLQAQKGL